MEPPGLIKLEKEIEQEETLSAPLPSPSPSPTKSPGKKSTGKLLDDAVSCGRNLVPICPILVCTDLQKTQKPSSLLITPFSLPVHFLFINSHLVFRLRKD